MSNGSQSCVFSQDKTTILVQNVQFRVSTCFTSLFLAVRTSYGQYYCVQKKLNK